MQEILAASRQVHAKIIASTFQDLDKKSSCQGLAEILQDFKRSEKLLNLDMNTKLALPIFQMLLTMHTYAYSVADMREGQ